MMLKKYLRELKEIIEKFVTINKIGLKVLEVEKSWRKENGRA